MAGVDISNNIISVKVDDATIGFSATGDVEVKNGGIAEAQLASSVAMRIGGAVSATAFGAVGDGVTDDTAAIQAALDSGANTVILARGTAGFVIDSDLYIPDYVGLVGDYVWVDPRKGSHIENYTNRIILANTASIILGESSSIKGCMIVCKGITIPANEAAVATWTGTAITTAASAGGTYIGHCSINGFDQAITTDATNTEQMRCEYVNFDCQNGIKIDFAADIVYIENCHGWPSLSIESTGVEGEYGRRPWLVRSGSAFTFVNKVDWGKITNCFSYGYEIGFELEDVNSCVLTGCGADDTGVSTTAVGFSIAGTCAETTLIGCQVAAKNIGYHINTNSTLNNVSMIGCKSWAIREAHIKNEDGMLFATNCRFRFAVKATSDGVATTAGTETHLTQCSFHDMRGDAINNASTVTPLIVTDCTFVDVSGGYIVNPYTPTVASASPLVLSEDFGVFHVTGTTNFDTISNPDRYSGKQITLIFADSLTVIQTTGNLKLDGNFSTTADYTLTLYSDGTSWYEIGRSTN